MKTKDKLKEILAKLKTVKNIEIIAAVVIIGVVALIYSTVGSGSCLGSSKPAVTSSESKEESASSLSDTYKEPEERLAGILSKINGAGEVSVLITYDSTAELITAETTNTHSTQTEGTASSSISTNETKTPLVVNNEVVVVKEVLPAIKGVIVVAEGAADVKVRLELLRAVQTSLCIDGNAVEIFAGK